MIASRRRRGRRLRRLGRSSVVHRGSRTSNDDSAPIELSTSSPCSQRSVPSPRLSHLTNARSLQKCKLQMAPPSLPFVRTLRRSADVVLSFTPRSDPAQREVVVRRAYIFLLTDLFLICERMSSDDRAQMGGPNGDGPDMWLLYPPLAGKHLRVREGVEDEVEVTVMGKEKLVIRTEGRDAALEWWRTFEDVIAFGVSRESFLLLL